MKPSHFAILGAMLAAIALQIAGLDHWADAIKPQFVAGMLLAIASTLTAMFSDKPAATVAAPPVAPKVVP